MNDPICTIPDLVFVVDVAQVVSENCLQAFLVAGDGRRMKWSKLWQFFRIFCHFSMKYNKTIYETLVFSPEQQGRINHKAD
jgi:hypothetical protein